MEDKLDGELLWRWLAFSTKWGCCLHADVLYRGAVVDGGREAIGAYTPLVLVLSINGDDGALVV